VALTVLAVETARFLIQGEVAAALIALLGGGAITSLIAIAPTRQQRDS
jgi:hypothetical protein